VNATVNSGGSQTVMSGGVAINKTIQAGGYELVMSGGAISGATIAGSGSILEIMSGGSTLSSIVNFTGDGGQLVIDSTKFRGKIQGFTGDDTIDLAAIAYNSGTTTLGYQDAGTSGTLTVTDGTHTARLAILGSYVAANFTLSDDHHGGTLINDPPVSSGGGNLVTPH
jgi:autotransporter passenger strand-loop-strand repeat protein